MKDYCSRDCEACPERSEGSAFATLLAMTDKLMDIQELLASAKTQTFDRFEQKLNTLIRENYRFSNLDEANRKIVLDIIKKHIGEIHNGLGISSVTLRNEEYKLYQNRIKLKLTEADLADMKQILELFKK